MRATKRLPRQIERPGTTAGEIGLGDLRFRSLLSAADWERLPPAVRRRFSKRVADGASAIYVGSVAETGMSRLGWLVAQALRIIGGPLPTARDFDVPSAVTVTEDFAGGGQIWTRLYARRRGFPQVIHSAKRFSGPTGLEEHVGCGLGMALTVAVEDGALTFRSAFCFLDIGPWRVRLPLWLTPGHITVAHEEIDANSFRFSLEVVHPWAGRLLRQVAIFREAVE